MSNKIKIFLGALVVVMVVCIFTLVARSSNLQSTASGGSGSLVTGSTDNAVLRADGTGGSTSQGSSVIISDGGAYSSTLTTDSIGFFLKGRAAGQTAKPFVIQRHNNTDEIMSLDYQGSLRLTGDLYPNNLIAANGYVDVAFNGASDSAFDINPRTGAVAWTYMLEVRSPRVGTPPLALQHETNPTSPMLRFNNSSGTKVAAVHGKGGFEPAKVTADPCGDTNNYPIGTMFYNNTSNYLCFCGAASADLKVADEAVACF